MVDNEFTRKQMVHQCPVCGTRHFVYLFAVGSHRLVRCRDCEFALLNPQPSDAELRDASQFPDSAAALGPGIDGKRDRADMLVADSLLAQIKAYSAVHTGRMLVLGPAGKCVADAAARCGFNVTTFDSIEAIDKPDGFQLVSSVEGIVGGTDTTRSRETLYDVCVILDSIERVRAPRQLLASVHRMLRRGGVILLTTPSLDSKPARAMSTRWEEFKREHLSYFNRRTIEGLLFSEGFRQLVCISGPELQPIDTHQRSHFASRIVVLGRREERRQPAKLSIIVPVYNEAATVGMALDRLLRHPMPAVEVDYVIVESNSTDGTRAIVQGYADRPGVQIVLEDRPRGKGHAVRTGLKAAGGDFIAIQDADLEYDLEDYDALLDPLVHHREAFVLGARHGGRARKMRQFVGQPVTSMLLNFGHWFFTALLNACFLVRLKDPFTMYKLFRRDCIHGLDFECDRFDFDWELVIKLIRRGYVPLEIPVNYRSRSFKEGKKVSLIRDPLTWLRAVVRFRLARIPRWAPPHETIGAGLDSRTPPRDSNAHHTTSLP